MCASQARDAAQMYVFAYSRLAADLVDMVCHPFFTWLLMEGLPGCSSLPSCMRMLTVIRVAAAYAFVNFQARPQTPYYAATCYASCSWPPR
jgi:hypothetical protein